MRVTASRISVVCLVSLVLVMPTVTLAAKSVQLPKPSYKGTMSVETAMQGKKSARSFSKTPLNLQQVSQILWAAYGRLPTDAISGATIKVTPSAGGLYPLDIFLVSGQGTVQDLPEGIYMYKPLTHTLLHVASGDNRKLLAYASLSQMWIAEAPVIVVIAATFGRSTVKYRQRGIQYVFMEAGNANQNMYLQAVAMGLRIGTVGAFNDPQVAGVLKLPDSIKPLLVVPVGK
jgi:SagB-type dehydrogenase family enzyme